MRRSIRHRECWNCEQSFRDTLGVVFCSGACSNAFRAEAVTELAKRTPEFRAKQRAAREAARRALDLDELRRGPCRDATSGKCAGEVDAHHEDYDQPLRITWLCRRHHVQEHTPSATRLARFRNVVATAPDTRKATPKSGRPSYSPSTTYLS